MTRSHSPAAKYIGTLGTAPQIITITLDLLLEMDIAIREAVVLHTRHDDTLAAVQELQQEFARGVYDGIELRFVPIRAREQGAPFQDVDNEAAFHSLMQIFFQEIRDAHARKQLVHIGIAGGRKVMAIAAMVVAQLLFTENDGLWHLFSDFYDRDDQRLHAVPEQNSRLMRVPVLRYGNASQILAAFPQLGDIDAVLQLQEQWIRSERIRICRHFVEDVLTAAERQVVRLACQGLDNAAIAARLHKSERTVSNQLSAVYDKLYRVLDFPGFKDLPAPDRHVMIAVLAPYFALVDMGSDSQK